MKKIALFPGQGSQKVGMGKNLFEEHEIAKELFAEADKSLGFELSTLCFEGPEEKLKLTEYTQPALLITSVLAFKVSKEEVIAGAGHSLGEYSALVAAGSLELNDALNLVHKRGKYMQEAVKPGDGKMTAIMGMEENELRYAIKEFLAKSENSNSVVEIANINCPGQIVIAGDSEGVEKFNGVLSALGKKAIPLKVSAPFHCSLMAPAKEKLSIDLDAVNIKEPAFPIYSNVTAKIQNSPNEIRENLKEQVTSSVLWSSSVANMIKEQGPNEAIEFGSGVVLAKLMKRIDKSVKARGVEA